MTTDLKEIYKIFGSIILACFAAYLGYRSGIKGSKRKEFNEVADPLRERIKNLSDNLNSPHTKPIWPSPDDFIPLVDRCGFFEKRRLITAIKQYRSSCNKSCGRNNYGRFEIYDENDIQESLRALLKYLKRK